MTSEERENAKLKYKRLKEQITGEEKAFAEIEKLKKDHTVRTYIELSYLLFSEEKLSNNEIGYKEHLEKVQEIKRKLWELEQTSTVKKYLTLTLALSKQEITDKRLLNSLSFKDIEMYTKQNNFIYVFLGINNAGEYYYKNIETLETYVVKKENKDKFEQENIVIKIPFTKEEELILSFQKLRDWFLEKLLTTNTPQEEIVNELLSLTETDLIKITKGK